MKLLSGLLLVLLGVSGVSAEMRIVESPNSVLVEENGSPILSYVSYVWEHSAAEDQIPLRVGACYIHPLHDGEGGTLSYLHSNTKARRGGIFWSWDAWLGDRNLDMWNQGGARQEFERWLVARESPSEVILSCENAWVLNDTGEACAIETVTFRVGAQQKMMRVIDLDFRILNVSSEVLELFGSPGKDPSGLGIALNMDRGRYEFIGPQGSLPEDESIGFTPWADANARLLRSSRYTGVGILQHPSNPGYPHEVFVSNRLGIMAISKPSVATLALKTGEEARLRYRILVHRRHGDSLDLRAEHARYVAEVR